MLSYGLQQHTCAQPPRAMKSYESTMKSHVMTMEWYQALAGRLSRTTKRGLVDGGMETTKTLMRNIVKALFADAVAILAVET